MDVNEYLSLFARALPQETDINALPDSHILLAAADINDIFAYIAKAPWINWDAYLLEYPDIKLAGAEPHKHFIQFGIHEGRGLRLRGEQHGAIRTRPEVSIIIPNYNNSLYLGKCIDSAIGQTLANVEIIIVDDASTDDSAKIIQAVQSMDNRVIGLYHTENMSQHMARRNGVMVASGNNILFLDSDDYLAANACELLCENISYDDDIISFNFTPLNQGRFSPEQLRDFDQYHNNPAKECFYSIQILHAAFTTQKLSPLVWNKLYKAALAREAFSQMACARLPRGQDIYESLVLLSLANKVRHIPERLYTYRLADGISNPGKSTEKISNFEKTGDVMPHLKKYCESRHLTQYYKHIMEDFLTRSLDAAIKHAPPARARAFFERILAQYGLLETLVFMAKRYFEQWIPVANALASFTRPESIGRPAPRRVGIFYPRLAIGGVETIIRHLTVILADADMEVIVISEERSPDDLSLHPDTKIRYVHSSIYKHENIYSHLRDWIRVLKEEEIDLMLYQYAGSLMFLWELAACKFMDIPLILMHHHDFANKFIYANERYDILTQLAIFRAVDKLVVLSGYAEEYYRLFNIDAEYLPNPVPEIKMQTPVAERPANILVMSRFGDAIKQTYENLLVLKKIVRELPDTKMYFVGDFDSSAQKKEFYQKVHELDLDENVVFTGWLQEPTIVFDQCQILLSTSYWESFGMSIAEAQSAGMPCVIYDVLVMQPIDNPSIIVVPQRDSAHAAAALIDILSDNAKLMQLSEIASASARRFNFSGYKLQILELMANYGRLSRLRKIDARGYGRIIRSITQYAVNPIPG